MPAMVSSRSGGKSYLIYKEGDEREPGTSNQNEVAQNHPQALARILPYFPKQQQISEVVQKEWMIHRHQFTHL